MKKAKKEPVGQCPSCGGFVIEGDKTFFCSNWKEKDCEFRIWKNALFFFNGKPITRPIVKKLLKGENADMGTLISPKTKKVFYAHGKINSTPKGWRITITPTKWLSTLKK